MKTTSRNGMKAVSACFLLGAVTLQPGTALAGQVSDSQTNNNDGTATVTFVVTPTGTESIRDMHWVVDIPKKNNLKSPTSSGGPPGWSEDSTSNSDQRVWTAPAGSALSAGSTNTTFSFTFKIGNGANGFKKFDKSLERVHITATSDRSNTITSGAGGNIVFTGGPGIGGPNVQWPVKYVNFKEPTSTASAEIGTTLALRVNTTFYGGQAFKLYGSTALSTTESGSDNPLGIGIDTTQAIPGGWGLGFTPEMNRSSLFTESVDDLDYGVVTVSIPNDPDLVGEVFYLVAASDSDGDTVPDLISSPMRITVKGAGVSGGVELLPYSF